MTDRADWLAWRRGGIGGSDVAALVLPREQRPAWMGGPWRVWADKMGLLPEAEANDDMTFGKYAEHLIVPWFQDLTGLWVAGKQMWCAHREHDYHRCTVDGFVYETPADVDERLEPLGLIEEKAPRSHEWDDDEGIPAYYQAQGQWQMHVTETGRVWFAVLHFRRLKVYELARDQADIDYMVETVDRFWHNHVLTGIAPPADGSEATRHALADVYPGGDPDPAPVDPTLVDEWRRAKRTAKDADAVVAELENAIRAALGDHEAGEVGGAVVLTLKTQTRKGGLDEVALAADGIDLDKYRKPAAEFRVLRPATLKESR